MKTKLRIGQTYRVIKNINDFRVGDIVQVENLSDRYPTTVFSDKNRYWWNIEEDPIQLIPNTKSKWKYSRKQILKELNRFECVGFTNSDPVHGLVARYKVNGDLNLESVIKPMLLAKQDKPVCEHKFDEYTKLCDFCGKTNNTIRLETIVKGLGTEKSIDYIIEHVYTIAFDEGYKLGVIDEIECVETSGEHLDLQKKIQSPPTQTTKHLDKPKYELPMFKDLGSQLDDLILQAHKIVEQQKEINNLLDK